MSYWKKSLKEPAVTGMIYNINIALSCNTRFILNTLVYTHDFFKFDMDDTVANTVDHNTLLVTSQMLSLIKNKPVAGLPQASLLQAIIRSVAG